MFQWIGKVGDRLRNRVRCRTWDPGLASGRQGEDFAQRYLQASGYIVIARNFRGRTGGEVDLIARCGETLVFAEVKTRSTEEHGTPEQAVDSEKRRLLLRAASQYARRAGIPWERVRFDIVSVVTGASPAIAHRKDAFRAPEWNYIA